MKVVREEPIQPVSCYSITYRIIVGLEMGMRGGNGDNLGGKILGAGGGGGSLMAVLISLMWRKGWVTFHSI